MALEQGLARYFQLVAGGEQRLPGPPPDLKRFLASMQLGEGEYARLRGAAREECEAAALWVVTSLGIEGTRELALLMAGKEPADPRAVAALSSER